MALSLIELDGDVDGAQRCTRSWSYGALGIAVTRLSHELGKVLADDMAHDSSIGVVVRGRLAAWGALPSDLALVSMVSVMHLGCSFVPIDLELAASADQQTATQSAVELVRDVEESMASSGRPLIAVMMLREYDTVRASDTMLQHQLRSSVITIDIEARVHEVHRCAHTRARSREIRREAIESKPAIAYSIRTSGTTRARGRGAVVHVPHACVVPNVLSLVRRLECSSSDTWALASPFTFDPFIIQAFGAWASGGQCVALPDAREWFRRSSGAEALARQHITVLHCTPSQWRLVSPPHRTQLLMQLRVLLLGGEPFPSSMLRADLARLEARPRVTIGNVYGVTEQSVWSSLSIRFRQGREQPHSSEHCIGDSLDHTEVLLARRIDQNHAVAVARESGLEGELFVGGTERFCIVPSVPLIIVDDRGTEKRMHGTGDLGVYAGEASSEIHLLGRCDRQVKLNGHRVQLEQVEHELLLAGQGSITLAAVFAMDHEGEPLDPRDTKRTLASASSLLAVLSTSLTLAACQRLRRRLPRSMRALQFALWPEERFPTTANGKRDTAALLEFVRCSAASRMHARSMPLPRSPHSIRERLLQVVTALIDDSQPSSADHLLEQPRKRQRTDATPLLERHLIELGGDSFDAAFMTEQLIAELVLPYHEERHRQAAAERARATVLQALLHSPLHQVVQAIDREQSQPLLTLLRAPSAIPDTLQAPLIDNNNNNDADNAVVCIQGKSSATVATVEAPSAMVSGESATRLRLQQHWQYDELLKCVDATPLVVDTRRRHDGALLARSIYVGSHSGQLAAIAVSHRTCTTRWIARLPNRIESSCCCSTDGERVFVGCYDGRLYCVAARDGRLLGWAQTQAEIKSSPVYEPERERVWVASHDHRLYCCDAAAMLGQGHEEDNNDGNNKQRRVVLATFELQGSGYSTPVIHESLLLCASHAGLLLCIALDALPSIAWRTMLDGPVFASPLVVADSEQPTRTRAIVGTCRGSLYCLDADRGAVLWRVEPAIPAQPIFGTCRALEHETLLVCIGQTLHILDQRTGSEVGRSIALGHTVTLSTPALVRLSTRSIASSSSSSSSSNQTSMLCCVVGSIDATVALVSLAPERQVVASVPTGVPGGVFASPVVVIEQHRAGQDDERVLAAAEIIVCCRDNTVRGLAICCDDE